MWEPEPGWQRLSSGPGSSTVGVWSAGQDVVKRVAVPGPYDAAELSRPSHYAYWRREAEVALAPPSGPGLVAPDTVRVEEDAEGITLRSVRVASNDVPGPFAARALGRFAGASVGGAPWLCRGLLGDRLSRIEARDGWPTLARTTVADLADALWRRRTGLLGRLADLPLVAAHGDPTPQNLLARRGDDVVAIDWATFGLAPAGSDLGYFSLSSREDFDVLVSAYLEGAAEVGARVEPEAVRLAARVVAVYTAFTRAEWALARVAAGEGALAAKYRHPSVAPYLHALQRQFPQIEALLG